MKSLSLLYRSWKARWLNMGKVAKSFKLDEFATIAGMPIEAFAEYGEVFERPSLRYRNGSLDDDGDTYIYQDNGSSVLGVAHLDTVQVQSRASILYIHGERVLVCPKLDDRLGVYIITHVLPKLGITCDWLLTTGEETGNSSAEWFKTEKEYKWAFSFDRSGDDAVLYQFDHKALRKSLQQFGFRIGEGTFSDLSSLDIGCSGVNIGCGYHNEHGIHAYALLSQTFAQLGRFRKLWSEYHDKALPFDPDARRYSWRNWHLGGYASGYSSGRTVYSPEYAQDYVNGTHGVPDWVPGVNHGEVVDWETEDYIERLADEQAKDMERPDPVG